MVTDEQRRKFAIKVARLEMGNWHVVERDDAVPAVILYTELRRGPSINSGLVQRTGDIKRMWQKVSVATDGALQLSQIYHTRITLADDLDEVDARLVTT